MTVGDENILPAVVVVIEKETAETQRDQCGPANFRLRRFVNEQSVALVVIERDHLVGKVADHDAGVTAAIVVGRVHAHARPRNAVLAETDTCGNTTLLERSIFLVEVELVGLRIVRDHEVGPAVAVVVENRDAQTLRSGIAQPGLLGCVFKPAASQVVPQTQRRAFVRLGRAVRLVRAVERAIEIALLAPLHVVRDHEIEFAVAIVIHPGCAGRELVRAPHSRGLGDVGERAVAVVVKKVTLAQCGDEDVVKPVVVVVSHGNSEAKHGDSQACLARNVGKRAVTVVVVELERGRPAVRVSGKVVAVDQNDVGIAIVVVVDERATRPHGFRQPLLSEGTVVVSEVNAGLRSDIGKMYVLGKA